MGPEPRGNHHGQPVSGGLPARVLLGAVLVLGAASARGQDPAGGAGALDARVEQLERRLRTLESQLATTEPDAAALGVREAVANQERRLRDVEDTVRAAVGLAEDNRHALEQLEARLDGAAASPARIAPAPEATAASPAPPSGPPPAAPPGTGRLLPDPTVGANPTAGVLGLTPVGVPGAAGAPPPSFDDSSAQYKYAYDLLARADYAGAEEAFQAFISDHPDSPLTDNAYYWLGETYYVRSQYELAAASFSRGFQAGPDTQKAPDMLLKLGLSLVALGRNEDACSTFHHLETEYPEVQPRTRKRLEQGRAKAGCG